MPDWSCWLLHVGSALLTGLCFRGWGKTAARQRVTRKFPCRAVSLSAALVEAVRGALTGMLSVCAFVVLFYVLASPLASLGGRLGPALVGLTELFSLTPLLPPDRFGFVLASGCAGWGGLSVLCQTAAVLEEGGLSPRSCVLGKALQGALAALLALPLSGHVLGSGPRGAKKPSAAVFSATEGIFSTFYSILESHQRYRWPLS